MNGVLGLSTPWARGRIREPLRAELTDLIPDGYTIGVSVAPNNGKVHVWVNTATDVGAKHFYGYDAETFIRAAIAWATEHAGTVAV